MKLQRDPERCDGCGMCVKVCPQQILEVVDEQVAVLDEARCMGCFGCEDECHTHAMRVHRTHRAEEAPEFEPAPPRGPGYDVVVIGAGPAGLGAAIECARRGRSVLVCERLPNRRISHHADGGVLMTMPGMPAMEADERGIRIPELEIELPPFSGLAQVDRLGIWGPRGLRTGDEFPSGVPRAWMSDKDGFVHALADEAERCGATLWYGAKVVDYVKEGEVFTGVRLDDGETVAARVVVAADGVQGKLSKRAGLPCTQGTLAHAVVLAYEYELRPGVPKGLFYIDGDLQLEPDMPPAMAGVGVSDRIHVLIVLLFRKKHYKAPRPIDHYLERVLREDGRIREILGDALDQQQPSMLNGCRAVMHDTNRDVVRDGLISVGDAFVGGGELGNVPALTNGVAAGRVIVEAMARDDVSADALAPAASFITDSLAKVTEMNGRIKAMPLFVSEDELVQYFQVMQDANYPTLLFGKPLQQAMMFTRLMAVHALDFVRHPKLMKMMIGKVE